MTDAIKQMREDFMGLVDSHGADRWNTGCAETSHNNLEAKRYDKQAVKARDKITAAMTELLARLDAAEADAKRLDALDQLGSAYGFQGMHEGNRWMIEGPFVNVRAAIDAAIAQGVKP